MNDRRRRRVLLGIALVFIGVIAVLARPKDHSAQDRASSSAPVITTHVVPADVAIELDAPGRVTALNIVKIRSQVSGQVRAIAFQDGQYVRQGDVLVRIDPRPQEAMVAQDEAAVMRDLARLESARTNLDRYIPLSKEGVVSAEQASDQRGLVAELQATVASDRAALDRDRVQLSYTTITAPISGVLGLRLIDVGNVLDPASPADVVALTQIQPIAVLFPMPETDLPEIRRHQAASRSGLAVEAWSLDGSRQLDSGTLSALSNEVDVATGTLMLKAVFPNADRALWPGDSVAVRLVLDVQSHGLTLPAAAVSQGPAGPFAWTVSSDGTARMAPLKIRQQLRGSVLIESGLQAGDEIVTDGQYGLTPGIRVSIQAPSQREFGGEPSILRTNQPGRLGIAP